MSDDTFAAYEARYAAYRALAAQLLPHNKQALFEELAAAGIVLVVVAFDGSGDSGQIESVTAFGADNTEIVLPAAEIAIQEAVFETCTVRRTTSGTREVIDDMVFEFLEQTHSGWENNDGAYGEFTFSVTERTIRLEYNERYTATDYSEHEF